MNLLDCRRRHNNLKAVQGHSPPENIENSSRFNAISCILEWDFMHGASDK